MALGAEQMRKKFFRPSILDISVTLIVLFLMVIKGGSDVYNDAYWVTLIYIIAWGTTNLIKYSNRRLDKRKENKRLRYKKRHLDNPNSKYKEYPLDLQEIDKKFHYDDGFVAMKLLFGILATMGVAVYNAIITQFGNYIEGVSAEFKDFAICFYVDAFLIPIILMMIQAFSYNNNFVTGISEYIQSAFTDSKGKIHILRGSIAFIASIFFVGYAMYILGGEFYFNEANYVVMGIYIILGVIYLIYSVWSVVHKEKE